MTSSASPQMTGCHGPWSLLWKWCRLIAQFRIGIGSFNAWMNIFLMKPLRDIKCVEEMTPLLILCMALPYYCDCSEASLRFDTVKEVCLCTLFRCTRMYCNVIDFTVTARDDWFQNKGKRTRVDMHVTPCKMRCNWFSISGKKNKPSLLNLASKFRLELNIHSISTHYCLFLYPFFTVILVINYLLNFIITSVMSWWITATDARLPNNIWVKLSSRALLKMYL